MLIQLKEIDRKDKKYVGTKGYNCAVMRQNGILCPDGFIVIDNTEEKDKEIMKKLLLPNSLYVIRSSMGIEDGDSISNAGRYDTRLCIKGSEVVDNVLEMFEDRKQDIRHPALLIQNLIPAEVAGVLFTQNPLTGQHNIIINACLGAGENVVAGLSTPDVYEIIGQEIISSIELKTHVFSYGFDSYPGEHMDFNGFDVRTVISNEYKTIHSIFYGEDRRSSLKREQIYELVKTSSKLQKLFGKNIDVEFCISQNYIYILQARPITAVSLKHDSPADKEKEKQMEITKKFKGQIVSAGKFVGKVIVLDLESGDAIERMETVDERNVLVTLELMPELLYDMKKIGAIVTAKGGVLSHGAIVAREKRIPCVMGIGDAIFELKDGMNITVDADRGEIII